MQSSFKKELNDRIELKINYFEFAKKTELKTRIDEQTLELLRLQDGLSRLPISVNSANGNLVEKSPVKNNRKALLIGGSNYKNYSILKNVTNDINSMKKMLQEPSGFESPSPLSAAMMLALVAWESVKNLKLDSGIPIADAIFLRFQYRGERLARGQLVSEHCNWITQ